MSQSIIDLSRRAFIGGAAALGATSLIIPEFAFAETAAEKQAEADAVRNQLVGLQADLETAGENYYAALDEQESAQRSMEEQQVKIDETTEEIEGLQDRLSTRARSMYRSGSTTFIDFLLGASSFAEFTQNWELLNQINANDADLVDQTKAAREQLQAAKDEFARQEQIAAQKAAECKQIHDEVQVKVQNATDLMNSLDEEARALLEQEQAAAAAAAAAAHNDNPEIAAARARGVPIFERAQAWGYIMRAYKNAICVSGTHGKTTTTSMLTHIFMQADRDPTIMIGGFLPLLGAGHRVGKGDTIILESCEYCNSFLNFFPTSAVILDVDADHLDFFKDLQDVERSFRKFASLVPADGLIVANGDDKNTRDTLAGMPYLSFGFDAKNDVYGKNFSEDFSEFDVFCGGQPYAHLHLGVIGRHNALNALAACAVAWKFGISGETAAAALAEFHGAGRRLEYKGSFHGADVYDDYAHHPNELHALLQAVRLMHYRRVICAFQPHTYSRTKALFQSFVDELRTADQVVLADIYAAREQNTVGVSSQELAAEIPGAVYCPSLQGVTAYLRENAQPGDIILTVGAGDIYKAGEALFTE